MRDPELRRNARPYFTSIMPPYWGLLEAAQANPELYPELLVGVAGFNARFIDLPSDGQSEFIARATATVGR